MAGFECIASVGTNLERALNAWFTQLTITGAPGTRAVLARTEDFKSAAGGPIRAPALSIFLYRVDFNKSMRAAAEEDLAGAEVIREPLKLTA